MDAGQTRDRFLSQLRQFVLFHLGSDAQLRISPTDEGLEVEVEHQRVSTMHLRFSSEDMITMAENRARFEDRLLFYLTRHRRS